MQDRLAQELDNPVQFIIAAGAINPGIKRVFCTANTATDSYTVTLPGVSQSAGEFVYVEASIANSKVVTLTDAGDDAAFVNKTLDANDDHILLFSTGKLWRTVYNGIA
jgi:hypothetical protein